MRRLFISLLLCLPLLAQDTDWKVGFNFRATSGFVTDGDDEVYVLKTDTSSTERKTINGNTATFIWSSDYYLDSRDREVGYDRRLAGMIYWLNGQGSTTTFTVTLPQAGEYIVRLAWGGDPWYDATQTQYLALKDNGTTKLEFTHSTTVTAGSFLDASETLRTQAAWISSNTPVNVTFATTTGQMVIGLAAGTSSSNINHLYLEYVPPSARRRLTLISKLLPGRMPWSR